MDVFAVRHIDVKASKGGDIRASAHPEEPVPIAGQAGQSIVISSS